MKITAASADCENRCKKYHFDFVNHVVYWFPVSSTQRALSFNKSPMLPWTVHSFYLYIQVTGQSVLLKLSINPNSAMKKP